MTIAGWIADRRLAARLSLVVAWVLWTYALPEVRIPTWHIPIPYVILALLAAAVVVGYRGGPIQRLWREAPLLVLGPALLSIGTLLGYLLYAGSASRDVAWRLIALPWVIPLLAIGLGGPERERAWLGVTIGFIVLLVYGAYGFFTGRVGDPGEHTLRYFGIHYTPSTRNADALYFTTLFFYLLLPATASVGRAAWSWIGLSGLTGAAIVLTQARNAWLALVAGLLVSTATAARLHAWDRRTGLRVLAILAIGAVTVTVVQYRLSVGAVLVRRATIVLTGDAGGSLGDRITLIRLGYRWAITHPIFGIGPGTLRKRVADSGVHLDQVGANHVENSFLQAWLDGGILGGLGFLLLWFGILFRPAAGDLRSHERVRFACLKGLAAALTIYMFLNVTFDNLAFWLIIGLVAAYEVHQGRTDEW